MSTFMNTKLVCGLCGHAFSARVLTSTNAFGSPDLDLRPPQMRRSTMPMWLACCPHCGYVHEEIEKNGKQHKAFIRSKEYRLCEGNPLVSALARDFYRYALISLREKDVHAAYDAFLHASWASDDAQDDKGSVLCRDKAIALYGKVTPHNPNWQLRHADLLRRARHFTACVEFLRSLHFEDEFMQKVADFQEKLAQSHDDRCYRLVDCDAVCMTLYDEPFERMKSGKKRIEVRCNDEKRRALQVGDTILFRKQSEPRETLLMKVAALHAFDTFEKLYAAFPTTLFGYEDKSPADMVAMVNAIYPQEEQERWGALAIVLEE